MPVMKVLDGDGLPIYIDVESGSGTNIDPFVTRTTISGTVPVSGSLTTTGNVASDAADSGNPVKVGFKAITQLSDVTDVATNDRVDAIGDLDGAQIVRTMVPLANLIAQRVSDSAGASASFSSFPATAGVRNYITAISIYNTSNTNGFVDFRDGTAGTVFWTMGAPATGGSIIHFNPPLPQPSLNTALAYDVSAAIVSVQISVTGFQA